MADIRIRRVDPALHRGLRKSAVDAGLTLEEYCRRLLEGRGVEGNANGKKSSVTREAEHGLDWRQSGADSLTMPLDEVQQVSSPAAPPDIDDEPAPHDPEFCQQPGCRECKRLRDGQ